MRATSRTCAGAWCVHPQESSCLSRSETESNVLLSVTAVLLAFLVVSSVLGRAVAALYLVRCSLAGMLLLPILPVHTTRPTDQADNKVNHIHTNVDYISRTHLHPFVVTATTDVNLIKQKHQSR